MIESEFGLTKDMYDEIVAEAPIISFHPDRLVAVKAKKGKESEVKRALEDALTRYEGTADAVSCKCCKGKRR